MSRFDELFVAGETPQIITTSAERTFSDYALEDLLEEIPVSLDVFIKDKRYLGMRGFDPSPIQADLIKHVERIYYPEMYPRLAEYDPYWAQPIRLTNFHVAQWGKDGGKDAASRFSFLRIAYLFMCLKNPQLYLGVAEDDDVHMLNVAINADQAQRAFFNPLRKNIRRGYFKDRADSVKDQVTFAKSLIGISGHSKAESQEGLNLLLGVCDEIDGFKRKDEVAQKRGATAREAENTAEHIMNMMKSSGNSRFPKVFKQVYISYPRYLGSTIQKLTEQGRKENERNGGNSKWFVSGPYKTWEVNPVRFRSDFDAQYEEDPIEGAAKYECAPKYAADPYFKNSLALESCMREEESPAVEVVYATDGRTWVPQFNFREDFYPIIGARYAMHADMAQKGDRAGIAMSHITHEEEVERDIVGENDEIIHVTEREVYIKTDFVLALEADISEKCVPPREIQVRWARDLWAELKLRGFNVVVATFDGWQSLESRQMFESLGVESPLLSTDRSEEPWKMLRDFFEGHRISVPKSQLLIEELERLTKMPNGKVDHMLFGSKDAADALACSAVGAITAGGREDPSGARAYYAKPEFILFSPADGAEELQMLPYDPFNLGVSAFAFGTEMPLSDLGSNDSLSEWLD